MAVALGWFGRSVLVTLPVFLGLFLLSELLFPGRLQTSREVEWLDIAIALLVVVLTSYFGFYMTLRKTAPKLLSPEVHQIDVRWGAAFILWAGCVAVSLVLWLVSLITLGLAIVAVSKITGLSTSNLVMSTALVVTGVLSALFALRRTLAQSGKYLAVGPSSNVVQDERLTTQSRFWGIAWKTVSVPLGLLGAYYAYDLYWNREQNAGIALLAGCLFWAAAWHLWHRGRKHFVRVGHRLEDDSRSPILFLRPFDQDGALAYPRVDITPRAYLRALCVFLRGQSRYEDVLVHAFRDIGPLVAIGEPGEKLPETGAMRVYFSRDDEEGWRRCVRELIASSQLVLLQVGASEGLSWEVEEVTRALRSDPAKLVLCIPTPSVNRLRAALDQQGVRRETYRAFREEHAHRFPASIPEEIGVAQFVCFDDNWQPYLFMPGSQPILGPLQADPEDALAWLSDLLVRSH